MLAAAPMTHRGALMVGLMTSLVSGSRLVMGEARNTREIADIIENQKVTTFMGIPTIVSDLLHLHNQQDWDATSLRVVLASGAPVTAELINRFHEQWPNALAATGYGLSETGWCTFLRISDPPEKVYSSGRLAPATEIQIRDQSGQSLPLGETGEVHIRGPMNCAGYLENDEATNQAIDADGWFASGDLAFMDKDGYLNPVGRSKHTIIRGGLNIYAEEIEHMLQEHPAVREVAIVPYPDPRLGERACAYVSLHAEASFDLDELARFFGELDTARYTWPERVEVVDELPRNPIGKIDRIAISNLLQNSAG
jgi:acyl-CoA synthetase (AMP-forming)/AMP-acid ligase II